MGQSPGKASVRTAYGLIFFLRRLLIFVRRYSDLGGVALLRWCAIGVPGPRWHPLSRGSSVCLPRGSHYSIAAQELGSAGLPPVYLCPSRTSPIFGGAGIPCVAGRMFAFAAARNMPPLITFLKSFRALSYSAVD